MTRLCIFTNSDTPSVPCFEAEINWQGDALYKTYIKRASTEVEALLLAL